MSKINENIEIGNTGYKLGNIVFKLLWSNSNPTNSFQEQTLQLNLVNYDIVDIFYVTSTNEINEVYVKRIIKNYNAMLTRAWNGGDGHVHQFRRTATVSNNGIHFSAADRSGAGNYTAGYTDKIIPLYIIGYKTNLFS